MCVRRHSGVSLISLPVPVAARAWPVLKKNGGALGAAVPVRLNPERPLPLRSRISPHAQNRSRSMTLVQAATKSCTNFSRASSAA